jgi:hypothetical protein
MKHLLFAFIIGTAAMFGTPAAAHVVQATSSLSLADLDVNDKPQLERALKAAVAQVVEDTISFQPTLVALTDAEVIGERLYFRVLLADEEGERTIAELTGQGHDSETDTERPTKARMTL